ncbi:formylglycine-generating enzyme family protein [Desulfotignum balticum]|uniref:formylglycine-generating enzyme family protein n=1 Tax=Desulfotignum balticum TaxID=115781 RepID=UPI0004143AAC|nr:formylglycine-generating enzyme family protein [Desulfotignum balticum]
MTRFVKFMMLSIFVLMLGLWLGFGSTGRFLFTTGLETASKPDPAKGFWTEPVTGMVFVWIPGGCFQMGGLLKIRDEHPVHDVCLDGFWMGKYEVTNRQYRMFKPDHFCRKWRGYGMNHDDQPVVDVSWKDTKKFVKWMNRRAGRAFSLPTESQWEYAARAGTRTARFWGNDSADACRHANVFDITIKDRFHYPWDNHACDDGHILTAPVGRFLPNAFGLHDMLGNVSEWCEDVYDKNAYSKRLEDKPPTKPEVPPKKPLRVYRGGSWISNPVQVRSAFRHREPEAYSCALIGFRLVIPQIDSR